MTHSNVITAPDNDEAPLAWHEGDMPYSTAFGDHFYCQSDGRLECGHVFLSGNGLPERWMNSEHFRIGELGFGTGLNACETWRQWKRHRMPGAKLHFVSFELFPMQAEHINRALTRWPELDVERQVLVDHWPAEPQGTVEIALDRQTTLSVICGDALSSLSETGLIFDAWFLDGFAPSRNSAMWSQELMQQVFDHTVQGGSFATYAAAGFVRRNLIASGYIVERRPGFAGKREMLCGRRDTTAA